MHDWLVPLDPPHLTRPPAMTRLRRGDGPWPGPQWLPQALRSAALDSLLSHGHGLCLLAPDDAALARWLAGRDLDAWLADGAAVRELLLDHVLLQPLPAAPGSAEPASLGQALVGWLPSLKAPRLLDARGDSAGLSGPALALGQLTVQPIDAVLQRPAASLLQLLAREPALSDCAEMVERAGLACVLRSRGPFTFFAPSNDGLARIAARLGMRRRALLADAGLLSELLRYHLVAGRLASHELPWGGQLPSLQGAALRLSPLGLLDDGVEGLPLRT